MRHFNIRKGEWPTKAGAPVQEVTGTPAVQSAAIVGTDFPGLRPRFEVEEGAQVHTGQVLFRDRKHPEIAFVSPIDGRVSSVGYGPRRTLSACVVEVDGGPADRGPVDESNLGPTRQTLLDRGHWPAFRTRPFGRIPPPDARPAAIVVNAVHTDPHAPDPALVLSERQEAFELGLERLTDLTEGSVFVCQSPGAPLAAEGERIVPAAFSGSFAAGLASTQIEYLCPASPERQVWTIGYQDVAAIGQLFLTGVLSAERVVAISGPATDRPRLVKTRQGARLTDLCAGDAGDILSGSALQGRRAAFLGRFDDQVTILPARTPDRPGWMALVEGGVRALVPSRRLERALALDIPTVPLLRALAVGDSEAAMRLGCLSLVEEDVAALARRCTSGADYPRLLRRVLDDLMEDAA